MKIITNKTGLRKKILKSLNNFIGRNFSEVAGKLEVVFVSDSTMRRYNRMYAGKGGSTDVLSFDLDNEFVVIVSVDMAKRNAIFYHEPFEDELVRYVIHGILHLVGYDHKIDSRGRDMRNKEEELMRKWKALYYS